MYAVVIMPSEDGFDLKVFTELGDARACYKQFVDFVGKGGLHSISIYRVADATDTRDAAAAIQNRESNRIEILALKKRCDSRWVTLPDDFDKLVRKYWSEFSV